MMGWSASPSVGLLAALVVEVFCWVVGLSAAVLGVSVVLGGVRERVEVASSWVGLPMWVVVVGSSFARAVRLTEEFLSLAEVPLAIPMEDGGVAVVSTVLGSMVLESMVLGSMISVLVELGSSLRVVIPAAEVGSSCLAPPMPEPPVMPEEEKEVAGPV